MHLARVDDFRDCLEKATRKELELFATARGVTEIDPRMGAVVMRKILRAMSITNIETQFPHLRRRTIGQMRGVNATNGMAAQQPTGPVPEVDAAQDLMRQWQEQQSQEQQIAAPAKAENPMAALRAECKRRGIKLTRTAKMADLRAMLDG